MIYERIINMAWLSVQIYYERKQLYLLNIIMLRAGLVPVYNVSETIEKSFGTCLQVILFFNQKT